MTVLTALIGAGFLVAFQQKSETSGHLWWKETREIPFDERRPKLLIAICLFALAALLLAATARMFWLYLARAEDRYAARRLAEDRRAAQLEWAAEQAARQAWLATDQGRAWAALQSGEREYVLTLRVEPPEYWETVRDVEDAGWVFRQRIDHPLVRKTDVRPKFDGGHEVIRTATRDATFYFVRNTHGTANPTWEHWVPKGSVATEAQQRCAHTPTGLPGQSGFAADRRTSEARDQR